MHSKAFFALAALLVAVSLPAAAQVQPAAKKGGVKIGIGAGADYWSGNWTHVWRFGPAAWSTAEFWHGLGIIAEGHSMIAGGNRPSDAYKYFSGEGGLVYNAHRWRNFTPFVKAEIGFAGLSFPHNPGATYTHDTRTTWAIGGGGEYKLWRHTWARADYTYDNFPDFYSPVTGKHHTLNPNGVTLGAMYYFR